MTHKMGNAQDGDAEDGGRRSGSPGLAPHRTRGRGLLAPHLVSGADEGGGASNGQAQDDDGEGGQDVEDAVQLDRHDFVPFFGKAPAFRSPCPMCTMFR